MYQRGVRRFLWIVLDDRLVFSDGLSRDLIYFNLAGKKTGTLPTPLPVSEPISKQDFANAKKKQIESLRYRPKDTWYERYMKVLREYKKPYYKLKANLSGISTTPTNKILIEGPFDRSKKSQYWLISQEGKQATHFKSKVSGIKVSKHFVFFYTEDEEEDTRICYIKRRGSETEDLLRLAKIKLMESE